VITFLHRSRWFLLTSAGVLILFWVPYAIYNGWMPDQPDWAVFGIAAPAVTGIDLGLALAGLWSPGSPGQPSAPGRWVAPQPFGALIRTSLPLILPVMIVVVAGTAEHSVVVQVVAGALAGWLAWTVVVRAEIPKVTRAVALVITLLAVVYAIVALITEAPTDPILGSFRDRGGWPSVLLRAAVVFWVAAIILRLASFATSWVRALEAVLLACAIVGVVVWAGVIAGPDRLSDNALTIAGAFALAALAALVVEALAGIVGVVVAQPERVRQVTATRGALSERSARFWAGLGLVAALFASLALGAAVVIGIEETGHHGHPRLTAAGEVITAGHPTTEPGQELPANPNAFPERLVSTYMPELAFRHDEPWLPERVNDFLRDASLEGPPGTLSAHNTLANLPRSCPGGAVGPCLHLTINCDKGTDPCAQGHEVGSHPLATPARTGAVYVRVVTRDQAPKLFPSGVGTFGDEAPTILIEYWYFYRYDEWRSPVLTGTLVQRHEGDWEAVMVGLSSKEPLFVAYSQHCGGEWLPWTDAPVADTTIPRTHPLVAVARGSHANYPDPEQGHPPDWVRCSGATLPRGSVSLLSYASNIRDFTGYDYGWEPPDGGIINAQPHRPPMSFPGYWGGSNGGTQLVNEQEHTLGPGGGPKSPPLQSLWSTPLNTVFCSNWRYPAHVPPKCLPK
jgi:hypothetical protein